MIHALLLGHKTSNKMEYFGNLFTKSLAYSVTRSCSLEGNEQRCQNLLKRKEERKKRRAGRGGETLQCQMPHQGKAHIRYFKNWTILYYIVLLVWVTKSNSIFVKCQRQLGLDSKFSSIWTTPEWCWYAAPLTLLPLRKLVCAATRS